jgi:DNA-binding beta-propeller fold protein YncE
MVRVPRSRVAFRAVPVVVLASLAACGGGGGGAGAGKSDVVALAFPPAHALTDDPHVVLRGTTHRPARVAKVAANGLPAASGDGFANWTVDAALGGATTQFAIEAEDANGRVLSSAECTLEFAALFDSPGSLAFDPLRAQLVVADTNSASGLLGVDLATGRPTIVSGRSRGTGPVLDEDVRGVAADPPNDRAFVLADFVDEEIQIVELRTGDRRRLSGKGTGSGVAFGSLGDLDLDAAHGRLLAADRSLDAVLAVALANGARSVLSDATHGTGPTIDLPTRIVVDSVRGRAIVVANSSDDLISVDLATGDRALVSGATRGSGPPLHSMNDLAFEPATGACLVANGSDELLRVDLSSGDRSVVADDTHGTGPTLSNTVSITVLPDGRVAFYNSRRRAFGLVDSATGDRSDLDTLRIGDGPAIVRATALSADPALRDLLLFQSEPEGFSLWRLDPDNGDRTIVSGAGVGAGSSIENPIGFAVVARRGRAYVADIDRSALVAVDLDTGDRTVVSDAATGSGIPLDLPVAVAIDDAEGRAFVIDVGDFTASTLIGIDLETGDRSEFSGRNRGSGPALNTGAASLAIEVSGRSVFVLDAAEGALLRIDLVTGDRSIVSGTGVGAGPAIGNMMSGLALSADRTRAHVSDRFSGVVEIDLATGDRTLHSSADPSLGPVVFDVCPFSAAGESQLFGIHRGGTAIVQIDLASGRRAVMAR